MSTRLALLVASMISVAVAGCQCGTMSCHTGPNILPHSMMQGGTDCGCGTQSCATGQGLVSTRHGGCEGCGSMSCGGCGARGPIQHLRQLTRQSVCGVGCGDIYWGEWISDPPACCDPCDSWGGFTGHNGCCGSRSAFSAMFSNLLGRRHGDACGCSDCTTGYDIYTDPEIEYAPSTEGIEDPGPVPNSSVRLPSAPGTRSVIRRTSARPLSNPKPLGTGVRRAGYTQR